MSREPIHKPPEYHNAIKLWLEQRQKLLTLFSQIAAGEHEHATTFCTELIDYCALSHFKIYSLIGANTKSQSYQQLKEIGYFCGQYADEVAQAIPPLTKKHLSIISALGEAMAMQFELEDTLLRDCCEL